VTRFSGIDPGSDGIFVLTVSWDGEPGLEYLGKYGSAVRLQENSGPPTNQAPVVNAGLDQAITLPATQISHHCPDQSR